MNMKRIRMSKCRFAVLMVAVTAAVTVLLRFLPFLIFGGERKTPPYVLYLGKVLPYAIMGMLVVYCLRGMTFTQPGGFLPQLIAGGLTVLLYLWKKNSLISILGGTACYMLLIKFVFI